MKEWEPDDIIDQEALLAEHAPEEGAAKPLGEDDDKVGDHIVERLGDEDLLKFIDGNLLWQTVEECKTYFEKDFEVSTTQLCQELEDMATTDYSVSISDPDGPDCPLVYISPGFEALTGYKTEFATGRSCRFLQPTNAFVNDCVNLSERKKMRDFCMEPQKVGEVIVNLLLNERTDGARFWNLLKMVHVDISGKRYILGMQSTVEAFMPKALRTIKQSEAANKQIALRMEGFANDLQKIRQVLQMKKDLSLAAQRELAKKQIDALENKEVAELPTDEVAEMRLHEHAEILSANKAAREAEVQKAVKMRGKVEKKPRGSIPRSKRMQSGKKGKKGKEKEAKTEEATVQGA